MTLTMDDSRLVSIAQVRELLKVTKDIELCITAKAERYTWMEDVLRRFKYRVLRKRDKSIIKRYLQQVTHFSDAQLGRLINQQKKFGKVLLSSTKRHRFTKTYTADDIALLAATDEAHGRLSGPATRKIFERSFVLFGLEKFKRLQHISVAHLYNLRETRQYQSRVKFFVRTKAVQVPIGKRQKPHPDGRPGYIRVDTVHQGDTDKEKGVYHINLVDEITQWEIIGAVEGISEQFLAPLLEDLISQFPFRIRGFHSDNGSEYINRVVARLLNKLLIDQTKSRARHCNDNALAESKNGSIIRKHMGYVHIPRKHARTINEFYKTFFNPYVNYHRPSGFATRIVDEHGKEKRVYKVYLTPFEKLKTHLNASDFLKEGVTMEKLEKLAMQQNDNEAAQAMQNAKYQLFKTFHVDLPVLTARA